MVIFNIAELIQLEIIVIILILSGIIYLVVSIPDWLKEKKWKRRNIYTEENRKIAIEIINKFEELLSKYNIKLPNEERTGDENEACIYGDDYYDLEDEIIELLNSKRN